VGQPIAKDARVGLAALRLQLCNRTVLGVIGIVIDVIVAGASAAQLLDIIDHERKTL